MVLIGWPHVPMRQPHMPGSRLKWCCVILYYVCIVILNLYNFTCSVVVHINNLVVLFVFEDAFSITEKVLLRSFCMPWTQRYNDVLCFVFVDSELFL